MTTFPLPLARKPLRALQYLSAALANQDSPKPRHSDGHDLLKASWLAQHIPDGAHVLDVGCSDGRRLMDLSLFVRDLEGIGVELNQRHALTPLSPLATSPTLLTFDGEHLPFEDQRFEVGMICYVLHHLKRDHALALLEELARVSKHRLIILEDSKASFSAADKLRNWAHATEANLSYAQASASFRQNFQHTMFQTHEQWIKTLSALKRVASVQCVPLDTISRYKHHTLFVVELER